MTKVIKRALQWCIPSRHDPIVVASMGRSGSTLVYDALCEGLASQRFGRFHWLGRRIVADAAWEFSNRALMRGVVYKTHALASELPRGCRARVIFLFGRASDAAISVLSCRDRYGADWVAEHFAHMRARGSLEELGDRDVLRFEEQVDGWLGADHVNVLGLRYETLWDHIDDLSRFVGFPVVLPPRKARDGRMNLDQATTEKFAATYRGLDNKIAGLGDCILRGA